MIDKDRILRLWQQLRKYLLNKYILTCCIFAFIFTFCGEQSIINTVRRTHEISRLQREIVDTKHQISNYKHDIQTLRESPDNLEKFAREHYYMHAPNEDVFIIEE